MLTMSTKVYFLFYFDPLLPLSYVALFLRVSIEVPLSKSDQSQLAASFLTPIYLAGELKV